MSEAVERIAMIRRWKFGAQGPWTEIVWLLDVAEAARAAVIAIGQDEDAMEEVGTGALDALHALVRALGLNDADLDALAEPSGE